MYGCGRHTSDATEGPMLLQLVNLNGVDKYLDQDNQVDYMREILSSLDVSEAEYSKWDGKKQHGLMIARHHFDPRQLLLFKEDRTARNQPLTRDVMCTYANYPVGFDVITAEKEKLYFHVPNYEKMSLQRQEGRKQLEEQKEETKRAKWRQQKWKDMVEEANCKGRAAADSQLEAMEQVIAKYGGLSRFT
eukprot:scaffold108378_cov63-Attheya_sp.AAC.1